MKAAKTKAAAPRIEYAIDRAGRAHPAWRTERSAVQWQGAALRQARLAPCRSRNRHFLRLRDERGRRRASLDRTRKGLQGSGCHRALLPRRPINGPMDAEHSGRIVDLRTGRHRPAVPSDYQTTAAAVGDGCPIWRVFLRRITSEDDELERFIQRMLGYGLTSSIAEHALSSSMASARTASRCSPGRWPASLVSTTAPHHTNRGLHGFLVRPSPDRPRGIARRPRRHRDRDQGGPAVGREPHQDADRRRPDRRAHRAAGLLRVHSAFQAAHRPQSQAGAALGQ
jgi:hypothetical protein